MDQRDIIKAAQEQGWRVEINRQGHPMFYAPDGVTIVTGSGTSGDHRAIRNLLSRLQRAGLIWPWTARDRRATR